MREKGRFHGKSGLSLFDRLYQQQGGWVVRPVGDQLQPFWFQSTDPQGAHYIRQPLRPVAQGEPSPVFHQI